MGDYVVQTQVAELVVAEALRRARAALVFCEGFALEVRGMLSVDEDLDLRAKDLLEAASQAKLALDDVCRLLAGHTVGSMHSFDESVDVAAETISTRKL